jgi:hypothetical protein
MVDYWALPSAAFEICVARKAVTYIAASTLSCVRHCTIPCLPALWISANYGEMKREHTPQSCHLFICPNYYS